MRSSISATLACALASCALAPPKPAQPAGEYRPINVAASTPMQRRFDFDYEGDISGTLAALKEVAPGVSVLPAEGPPSPVPVSVQLQSTDLEGALRAIGEEGRGTFEVVWITSRAPGIDRVFVRFRTRAANASAEPQEQHGSK
jgi:hypothetical protein